MKTSNQSLGPSNTEPLHLVDLEGCKGDGICVETCPEDVLEITEGKAATVASRRDACILCGQCVAVCPTGALRMPQLADEDFLEASGPSFGYTEFYDFLRQRRSVRVFKGKPVQPELVEKVLKAASTAPMGLPPHSTEVLVVDRREELDLLLKELVKDYAFLVKSFSNPIGRVLIRLSAGAENYAVLKDSIVDMARYANESYRRDASDYYLRKAPVLLLFHGNRRAMSYVENAHLVCHHAMLAAVSLGLGTTIIGLVPPMVDRSTTLRKRWGIPKENKVVTSLILGHPKFKFRKGIDRQLAGVRRA